MKVLDCTLRDGGYYNDWDFDRDLVQRYLDAIGGSNIDAIEIGFRFPPKEKFLGAFAHISDDMIRSFILPDCKIAVMVNAEDFIGNISIEDYFVECQDSPVDIVRVAVHFDKIDQAIGLCAILKSLGYIVALNIMQASSRFPDELEGAGDLVEKSNAVDILYLADSLGDLDTEKIHNAYEAIYKSWNGDTGFHGHNNRGLALQNSLYASDKSGVEWIDGTILGMGRGAGNTETEYLLIELAKLNYSYKPESLYAIVSEDFEPMKQEYRWGPSLAYYLSASFNIHPTYVQEMMSQDRYDRVVFDRLSFIRDMGGDSFDKNKLSKSKYGNLIESNGSWDASNWVKNKDVIIIASGPNGLKHANAVNAYRLNNDAFCIGLNQTHEDFDLDAYAICNYVRLSTDLPMLKEKPILAPLASISKQLGCDISNYNILDYGVDVRDGLFCADMNGCSLPYLLVAPYAIAAASAGGAKRILLVGFDGYSLDDPKRHEMEEVFELCSNSFPDIYAVTPTKYHSVLHRSIYCI